MTSWGAVNAALNRLVARGLITRYQTNLGEGAPLGLHVIVTVSGATGGAGRERIRREVLTELERLTEGATVTVRHEP
jgi:hypothetical protein